MFGDSDSLYKVNMAHFRRISSSVSYANVENAPDECECYDVIPGKNFRITGGRDAKHLHSSRAPEREARNQVEKWEKDTAPHLNGMIVAPGFAGMYHLKALVEKTLQGGMILIVEPQPCLLKKAFRYFDIKRLSRDGVNIVYIVSENPEGLKREFRHYLKSRRTLNVSFFLQPGLQRAFPGVYENILSLFRDEAMLETSERTTRAALMDKWTEHSICNLPNILRSPEIGVLKNVFSGTAVVVGAGPSLNDSFEYIKEVRRDVALFAVGTALKPLLSEGISPDFVVQMDSDFATEHQFEGVALPEEVFMLSSLYSYPSVLNLFRGRTFFFSTNTIAGFEDWLKGIDACPARLAVGGTVSLTALDAAVYMGFRKIIFTGLDLAYAEDGTTHAKCSMYGDEKESKEKTVKVKGNYGREVFTTVQFLNYIKMLGSYLLDSACENKAEFYNATAGGAEIANSNLIKPREIPGKVLWSGFRKECLRKMFESAPKPTPSVVGEYITSTLEELKEILKSVKTCTEMKENVNYAVDGGFPTNLYPVFSRNEKAGMFTAAAIERFRAAGEACDVKEFLSEMSGTLNWLEGLLSRAEECFRGNGIYNYQ
jgi:hypothetical protein